MTEENDNQNEVADDTAAKRTYDINNLPRTIMSPAYVTEKEPGVFAMYRDFLLEENGVRTLFGKPLGPMFLFRRAKDKEPVDFITSTESGEEIKLFRYWPPAAEVEVVEIPDGTGAPENEQEG